ncbi:MAG: hypothetical protein K2Q01_08500 [Rickettsiales bacterium]|nr:hypothetical protein [Rickettsiales bacterium]
MPTLVYFYAGFYLLAVMALNCLPGSTLVSPASELNPFYFFLLGAIGFASCYASYRSFRFEPRIYVLLLGSVLFYFLYFIMHANARTYDLQIHKVVIDYWREHHAMPWFFVGAEFSQAQLYYCIAGTLHYVATLFMDSRASLGIVTGLNFFFFTLFLTYGIRLLRLLLPSSRFLYLAICAFLAWPNNLIQCARITNDILLYLSFTACTYHFLAWRTNRSQPGAALTWLGVALGTKSSSGLLVMGLAVICAYDYYKAHGFAWPNRRRLPLPRMRPLIWPLAVVMLGFFMGFGRNIYFMIEHDTESLLMAQAHMYTYFSPMQFLWMHIPHYLTEPYIYVYGSQSKPNLLFWNFFLKTLSFGEFRWNGIIHAVFMNALSAMMMGWLFVFYLRRYASRARLPQLLRPSGICLLFMGLMLLGLAYMKVVYGMHAWADVRHIYPFIVFFIAAYCMMLEYYATRHACLCRAASALLVSYLGLSLFHMMRNFV